MDKTNLFKKGCLINFKGLESEYICENLNDCQLGKVAFHACC